MVPKCRIFVRSEASKSHPLKSYLFEIIQFYIDQGWHRACILRGVVFDCRAKTVLALFLRFVLKEWKTICSNRKHTF